MVDWLGLDPPSEELRKKLLEEELKLRKRQPQHWAKSKYRKYAKQIRVKEKAGAERKKKTKVKRLKKSKKSRVKKRKRGRKVKKLKKVNKGSKSKLKKRKKK